MLRHCLRELMVRAANDDHKIKPWRRKLQVGVTATLIGGRIPGRSQRRTSAANDATSVFSITCLRWTLMVYLVIPSRRAICLFSILVTVTRVHASGKGELPAKDIDTKPRASRGVIVRNPPEVRSRLPSVFPPRLTKV